MPETVVLKRPRGRPPKDELKYREIKNKLIHAGLEMLTEKGFATTGLDGLLSGIGLSKGSFYHYFESKEAFGLELIDNYAIYFARKLDYFLGDEVLSPLERIRAYAEEAENSMRRFNYKRGCLVGNLGQEMNVLPESFRNKLKQIFSDWQSRLARCLEQAQAMGEVSAQIDVEELAAFFWIGWEGAVLRTKLEQNSEPLRCFIKFFFKTLSSNNSD